MTAKEKITAEIYITDPRFLEEGESIYKVEAELTPTDQVYDDCELSSFVLGSRTEYAAQVTLEVYGIIWLLVLIG